MQPNIVTYPANRTRPARVITLAIMMLLSMTICTNIRAASPIVCHDFFSYGNPPKQVTNASGRIGQYLCREGYVSAYSYTFKEPVVVTYHLTAASVNHHIRRQDMFTRDADVPKQFQSTLADYRKSGYDRGHLAPYAAMDFSALSARQSFLLSNMSPQKPGLNRAGWAQLETYVRRWATRYGAVWVYDGALYQHRPVITIGQNKVGVPDAFFKVIYAPHKALGSPVIAFIMPNAPVSRKQVSQYRVSVHKIEQATGLHFLTVLSAPKRHVLCRQRAPMWTIQASKPVTTRMMPPAYLRIAQWQHCLATQANGTWQAYCMPKKRHAQCPIHSWTRLQHLTTPLPHCR